MKEVVKNEGLDVSALLLQAPKHQPLANNDLYSMFEPEGVIAGEDIQCHSLNPHIRQNILLQVAQALATVVVTSSAKINGKAVT